MARGSKEFWIAMKVRVDERRCTGHGVCEAIDPEIFEVSDDGVVRINTADVAGAQLTNAEMAVAQCPSQALTLEP
jgi:ferredoxin